MAASASDYFMKVGRSTATTLSAPGYTIGNTSVNVGSTSNWPSDTGVMFAIDEVETVNGEEQRVTGTYNVFRGTVASGTSINNVTYVGGDANRDYSAGVSTRVYILVSSDRDNRLVDGLLVEHKQDGTHGDITADSVATDVVSEVTSANGVTVDGLNIKDSKLNTDGSVIPANLLAGTGTDWSPKTWTPTWTNLTVGNGSGRYYYQQIGKLVFYTVLFTAGSTSAFGSAPTISLPVTAQSASDNDTAHGMILLNDAGGARVIGTARQASTTTVIIGQAQATGSSQPVVNASIGATSPFTMATGDTISWSGFYWAA